MSTNLSNAKGGEYATSRRGALTTYEVDFVQTQAAKGRSAQTIANMIGRSRDDIAHLIEVLPPAPIVALERPAQPVLPAAARDMVDLVARKHGVFYDEILGRSQRAVVANARLEAYARLRAMRTDNQSYRFSTPQIASWFGRDHSTILQGAASFQRQAETREAQDLARWRQLGKVA